MASYSSLSALFTAIADNIRAKLGSSEDIVAIDFPEKIAEIPSGEPTVSKVLTINRRDSSSAPSNLTMLITYPFVSNGAWASVTKTLSNGGSIEIPIPDIQTQSTEGTVREATFRIFVYTPSSTTRYIIYKVDEVPNDVIYYEENLAVASSSEKKVLLDVNTLCTDLLSRTAVVTLQVSGTSS